MPVSHAHLSHALQNPDVRRSCYAVEAIFRAADTLDELPPACLEEVRDYCSAWNEGRKGSFSEFKRAWIEMVVERLNDQPASWAHARVESTGLPDYRPRAAQIRFRLKQEITMN